MARTRARDEETFVTIKELAARWQVSGRTVRRLIDRGELPVHRIASQIRISMTDIRAYERRNRH